jgi:hypothetical protein
VNAHAAVATISSAIASSGTASVVACAVAAESGAPTVSPSAYARLNSVVARISVTPTRSADSCISDAPGIMLNVGGPPTATIISTASGSAACGTTSSAISGAPRTSPLINGR